MNTFLLHLYLQYFVVYNNIVCILLPCVFNGCYYHVLTQALFGLVPVTMVFTIHDTRPSVSIILKQENCIMSDNSKSIIIYNGY